LKTIKEIKTERMLFTAVRTEIAILILLLFMVIYLMLMQQNAHEHLNAANQIRYESYLLADRLRQSSDDLTRMVRTYAATGDSRFETYFFDILAIRNGDKARPLHHDRAYWDFMAVKNPAPPFPDGEKVSLNALMHAAGFSPEEMDLLALSQERSDKLVELEQTAMNAMKGRFKDDSGSFTQKGLPDPDMARRILYSEAYHEAKKGIMEPINAFFAVIDMRTSLSVRSFESREQFYYKALAGVLAALIVNGLLLAMTIRRYNRLLVDRLENALECQAEEIEERKRTQETLAESNRKLTSLSVTDGLTGLANRRRFDEALVQEFGRHARAGAYLSMIMIDIDHFKRYNDTYGHLQGDRCLSQVADAIAGCVNRNGDIAARYGGEEFACILPDTSFYGAVAIARNIRKHVNRLNIPHEKSPVCGQVTVSAGVATSICLPEQSVNDLVALADKFLYRAKENGRNRVEFLAPADVAEKVPQDFVRFVWKEAYACGHPLIDEQHRCLFRTSNDLFEAMTSEHPREVISGIIARLLKEVTAHFKDEEEIVSNLGFSSMKQHRAEHTALLEKGLKLSEAFEVSSLGIGDVVHFLAYEVVMSHMLKSDRKFYPLIAKTDWPDP
jgi:diguanylate cyclase (GGDEF)-like protein/hemerythrin-like metal-binding protein